jgi:MFS family permease
MTSVYAVFLGFRALGGVGWAMFGTVATTVMVDVRASEPRGRSVSRLFTSEALGLLVGSMAGGWLYQGAGIVTPFLFEAACMVVAAIVVVTWLPIAQPRQDVVRAGGRQLLRLVLRIPGVLLMSVTSAVLIALQTGVLVFLFPLYLANRASIGPEMIGVLVGLGALGRLVALWLGGSLSDRHGRMRVLIPGLAGYAALLGSLPFLTHPIVLGVWSLLSGAAAGFVTPIPTAVVGDRVPPHLQSVAIGWLRTMTDSGHLLGPLLMGPLADAVDLSAPFFAGAALLVATAWGCGRSIPLANAPRAAS